MHRRSVIRDRALPALSRAANHGLLWLAAGAGMGLTRDPRARRAALRGLIALAVAGTVTHLAARSRLGRSSTPSIATSGVNTVPSGHAAAAAAFATGVALEAPPLLTVPVAVAATAVAASRVVTGDRRLPDVLTGAAVGVGAGQVTQWWWPRRPRGPARACRPTAPAPATATGAQVTIVINTASGTADDHLLDTLVAELPEAEIIPVEPDEDLDAVLADAAKRAGVLGVAGGDGTVNAAARHAIERDIPLLAIPAGTLNHFARELGVDTVSDALTALRAGTAVYVDVGRVDNHVFLNTCSLGLYADLVRFRARWEPLIGKWPALLAGLLYLPHRAQPRRIVVDGAPRRLWMLFAGNGRYRPAGFAPAYRPRLDDQRLDVRIVDATVPYAVPRVVAAALIRTLRWCRAYQVRAPHQIRLAAPDHEALALSVDGESIRVAHEVTVSVDLRCLLVYRPARTRP
jgi:undecaprenyl-diphosphatase